MSGRLSLFATAVQTSMFGAAATGLDELLAERRTRTMQADSGIGCGKIMLPGEILGRLLSKIDGAQDVGVFRFQAVHNAIQARTDFVLYLRGRLDSCFQFVFPGLQSPVSGFLPPVVVDHSIAQQAIEPSDSRFVRLEIVLMLERAQVRGLENVFGERGIRDAALHNREKLLALVQKLMESCVGHRVKGGSFLPPEFVWTSLAARLAGADYAVTDGAAGAVLAFHGVSPL